MSASQESPIEVIILAAGKGQRMISNQSKILHRLAGRPLLGHVIKTAQTLNPAGIHVVYGHNGEEVRPTMEKYNVSWVEQKEQLGTGHAVLQALPNVADNSQVLILFGDVPLVAEETLSELLKVTPDYGVGIVTAEFENPQSLGRVVRDKSGNIMRIVEQKDASETEKQIKEIYSGILTARASDLKAWLGKLDNKNAQHEYYLTDVVRFAVESKRSVVGVLTRCPEEVLGVNDRIQLANLERYYQKRAARRLMLQGVTMKDPSRFELRGEVHTGKDVTIDINVILLGCVKIGANCRIGANCILKNVELADNVEILPNSIVEGAVIESDCRVGPFARIRPETTLKAGAHIGNFVEIKNSTLGKGSKAGHIAYIGDSQVGQNVNFGAGTITCNYDGAAKYTTTIKDNAFIGSASQLIAPVTIEEGAYIGAGSTITKDAPAEQLTLSRAPQKSIKKPVRKQKD